MRKWPRSVYDEWNIVFVAFYYRRPLGLNVCENNVTHYIKLNQSNSFLNCFLNINNAHETNIILLLSRTDNIPSASWRFCQTVYIRIEKKNCNYLSLLIIIKKPFGEKKPKGSKHDSKIDNGYICLKEIYLRFENNYILYGYCKFE